MSSHSLSDNPKVFFSARLRLLWPAFHFSFAAFISSPEPFSFTFYSKTFRLSAWSVLTNRFSRTKSQVVVLCIPCGLLSDEKFQFVRTHSSTPSDFPKPKFLPIFHFLNQLSNEPLTAIFRLTNFESKLSVPTSALSECESEDSDDQESRPVKNFLPSPFFQSSLLSLIWWIKSTL